MFLDSRSPLRKGRTCKLQRTIKQNILAIIAGGPDVKFDPTVMFLLIVREGSLFQRLNRHCRHVHVGTNSAFTLNCTLLSALMKYACLNVPNPRCTPSGSADSVQLQTIELRRRQHLKSQCAALKLSKAFWVTLNWPHSRAIHRTVSSERRAAALVP